MNYDESVRALISLGRELSAPRQPAQSNADGARVQKFGLENISILATELGNPQLSIPCVHIAGTNGKGSTAAMLESILRAAGMRTYGLVCMSSIYRLEQRLPSRNGGVAIVLRFLAVANDKRTGASVSDLARLMSQYKGVESFQVTPARN